MSDKQEFDRLVEQIRALGLDPEGEIPPHVRDMLKEYGTNSGDLYVDDADLMILWQKANTQIAKDASKETTDKAATKAAKTGVVTPEEAKALEKGGLNPAESGVLISTTSTPRWVLEHLNGDPTPEQQRRIVREWNTVFGTRFNWDQLVASPQFSDPTETTTKVVESAVLDIDPVVSYSVTLPGNRQFQITDNQMKTQFGLYGFKNEDLARVVRWADTFQLKDATGKTAWQPLAALIKAKGLDLSVGDYVENPDIDSDTGRRLRGSTVLVGKGPHRKVVERPKWVETPENKKAAANQSSIALVTYAYKQNLKKYGDPTMAFLASLDQGLADRLMMSGGDDTKVSNEDRLLAQQHMLNGQWSNEAMNSLGYAGGSGLDGFFGRMRDSATPAAATRVRPDPDSLRQAAKDLWRRWFRSDPSEAWLDKTAGELMAAYMSAPDDQSVDISARLRKMAEGSDEYGQLYGNKQPGQTEEDYQAQFVGAAQSILGNEAAPEGAITAGMKTGQYQTTVGAAAAAGLAAQNSTLLGRLATAAQIINERT